MAEINTIGYQKIRDYIEANWKYIELQDGTGTPIIRLGVDDARVSWTHTAGSQTLKLQIVLNGSDITLPKTFEKSAIFDVASGGTALTVETFTAFTMEGANDELTVEHSIEVPQVV
ncbi:hypothetical protein P9858_23805 [Niallia circulans]|uniref:hypothetical protein n=1 Tax=Niallia circulans TaxID=1397 RepID=UPI002E2291F9|nr:hypothetical protein [Niallia circulans]